MEEVKELTYKQFRPQFHGRDAVPFNPSPSYIPSADEVLAAAEDSVPSDIHEINADNYIKSASIASLTLTASYVSSSSSKVVQPKVDI